MVEFAVETAGIIAANDNGCSNSVTTLLADDDVAAVVMLVNGCEAPDDDDGLLVDDVTPTRERLCSNCSNSIASFGQISLTYGSNCRSQTLLLICVDD
ncbi:hypothetical protein DERP_003369 [Dermatophagoides pteronyssinus]|uniref:Uncharacterized protein n=1 Tax=Dermatophagoides pteronyssinus TaxID=6956 RepID=A0ABQ8JJA8_DERPT|nr:hypothetical protein DERP_003369 [Dermatophagoides pteronyssinus]